MGQLHDTIHHHAQCRLLIIKVHHHHVLHRLWGCRAQVEVVPADIWHDPRLCPLQVVVEGCHYLLELLVVEAREPLALGAEQVEMVGVLTSKSILFRGGI